MKKTLAISVIAGLGLAACDDTGTTAEGIDTLGQTFVRAFQQGPNDDPVSLDGVTIPSFATQEPFDV